MRYFAATNGINIVEIEKNKFILEDALCNCSLPFEAVNEDEISVHIQNMARLSILCSMKDIMSRTYSTTFRWFEIEKYYAVKISDLFRIWQYGNDFKRFDEETMLIPPFYSDFGHGVGDRLEFIKVHELLEKKLSKNELYFGSKTFYVYLAFMQVNRICSDILALLDRAIQSFYEILILERECIKENASTLSHESFVYTNEIVHTGLLTYKISSAATNLVISLCSSLDLSSKLIFFLNDCEIPTPRFKSARGKHFSDRFKIKPKNLDTEFIANYNNIWNNHQSLKSLIQFRHDLIHNTAALELEKLYIGFQTDQIKEFPIYYSYVPWRDCDENGQPDRFLGREFYIGKNENFEIQAFKWLNEIIDSHIQTGTLVVNYFRSYIYEKYDIELEI